MLQACAVATFSLWGTLGSVTRFHTPGWTGDGGTKSREVCVTDLDTIFGFHASPRPLSDAERRICKPYGGELVTLGLE
ncbi:hypothetical protein EYF80_014764 [Liparis tanakae]|uniref:Secreted protein n=1 Tax=Liparis tanakae TaxID=230148 RepID=A0A4Z2IAJ9_9TELE|nr:hypothetical protein EYF80_014764 [Liparis tanakae]